MKRIFITHFKKPTLAFAFVAASFGAFGQTNVYDDVISTSPNHTTLKAALIQTGLVSTLQDPTATLTVFAPDNAAFDALALDQGVTIAELLTFTNLAEILTYHVLGQEVTAAAITNGQVVTSANTSDEGTIYLTKTSTGSVFADQANVTTADLTTDNGIVHVVNKVLLPIQTVVDVAASNNFTTLLTAATQEELLPALTDPLATLTVFAPTNDAFTAIATALGTDINGLLAYPTLDEILKYHVLGAEVTAANVTNGAIVNTLSTVNTLKMTKTTTGSVYANHAMVTLADVEAQNGVVHVINNVVLPIETVVDQAIDGGFSTLVTAVAKAELLPALTNPLATLTVFAPTNDAFDDLAAALGTDINGILALPALGEILKYHVLGSEVLAVAITNGQIVAPLSTVNTLKLTKTTTGDVYIASNSGQVGIGTVPTTSYKLDISGTTRIGASTSGNKLKVFCTDNEDILTVNWSGTNSIGLGSNTANNPVLRLGVIRLTAHPSGARLIMTGCNTFGNLGNSATMGIEGNVVGTSVGTIVRLTSTALQGANRHNPTSGTLNMVTIGDATTNQYIDFSPASGSATFNSLYIRQQLNTSGTYSGIVRGVFYDPILTSTTGINHRAWENTTGDMLFGTTTGSTGIGANTSINASAILDVTSTTKGMLPPRMTTVQMTGITSPAIGLELYNTVAKMQLQYDGTAYKSSGIISGSISSGLTASTTITVIFGGTQPNITYKVSVTPTSALALGGYVTNKTTTTFDFILPITTGVVTFDYQLVQ